MTTATTNTERSFNLADAIFAEKSAEKPKKPAKPPKKNDGTTKPPPSTATPPTKPSTSGTQQNDAPVNTSLSSPDLANLFKEQFTSMRQQLEGFVTKLLDERAPTDPKRNATGDEENDLDNLARPEKRRHKAEAEERDQLDRDEYDPSAFGILSESEEGEIESDDDLLDDLVQQFSSAPDVGPPLPEKLATAINDIFENRLSEEKSKELVNTYKCPGNVNLGSAVVNPEVWSSLNKDTRTNDIKLQRLGSRMASTTYAMSQLLLVLFDAHGSKKELDLKHAIRIGMDAIALGCSAVHKLAEQRRSTLRPSINPQFRAICGKLEKEPADLLFGPGLTQRVKDLKETARVGTTFQNTKRGTKKDGSFLGRRGNYPQRGRIWNSRQTGKQGNRNGPSHSQYYGRNQPDHKKTSKQKTPGKNRYVPKTGEKY